MIRKSVMVNVKVYYTLFLKHKNRKKEARMGHFLAKCKDHTTPEIIVHKQVGKKKTNSSIFMHKYHVNSSTYPRFWVNF